MKSESVNTDEYCCQTTNENDYVDENKALHEVERLRVRLSEVVKNPVMKEFLEDPENKAIFYDAIEHPTIQKLITLDKQFKNFYRVNRIIRYLSGFIRRYPIDYDKRVKRRNKRYQLILNKPLVHHKDNTQNEVGDLIIDDRSIDPLEHLIVKDRNLFPLYNKTLDKAVQHLTPKQTRILDLYYDKGFTNKEIGGLFGETKQNISYWHQKTLNQLKEALENEEGE
ncbi:sigma-70 family RNA polymerase sigma factor [Bacillus subtilis]|uniref:YvrI n=1 Tax=Bacillus subtilis TaxID=1423 RepID=A0A0D1I6W1_BACIU|nr:MULTISPECIES: sigma-70 family RNA polymerase sigma factor [Bacillus subtilis group]AVB12162.1 sigma-70 family RNA polymerase sigma factor [Bacillus velezensis]AYK76520.1 sigma-70 family RNA polymerase sigma factor [Bacillus subtilis subsp. subtilis]AYL03149.1 sigma-70 family RNA polymerase sigma factor [Bacillus subtilis subsp. subtilis]KIU04528.1 YvrI [Bacillus subtilis]MCB4340378.1 RNA polymerase sigma factor SigO [Bacillus subtilis]